MIVATPTDTVLSGCLKMQGTRASAVVITAGERSRRVDGIFTERDVVRVIAEHREPSRTAISEFMTREPVCVTRDCDRVKAMQAMAQGKFRHLPIVASTAGRELEGLFDSLSLGHELLTAEGHNRVSVAVAARSMAAVAIVFGLWARRQHRLWRQARRVCDCSDVSG
jgi:signal-transduction protein with cAMP-binding, CBS, and nucleotidyltransferase domain